MGTGNGLSNRGGELRAPAIKTWGTALRWAREARGFTQRDVAENINVSLDAVQMWELDHGEYPSSVKLARIHGMMPQLRHFRFLIPKLAQRNADMQEVAAQRKEARKPETPPPPPTKTNDEKFQAALSALTNRYGSASAVAAKAEMTGSNILRIISGTGFCSPRAYGRLLHAFPELRGVPCPTLRAGGGNIYGPTHHLVREALAGLPAETPPQPAEALPPAPKAETAPAVAADASHGASVPSGQTSESTADPGPVAPGATLEELSTLYAKELRRLEAAAKRYEDAMAAAVAAEEEKQAAEASASQVLSRLQVAAGLKRGS
jgi:hypothetical protein